MTSLAVCSWLQNAIKYCTKVRKWVLPAGIEVHNSVTVWGKITRWWHAEIDWTTAEIVSDAAIGGLLVIKFGDSRSIFSRDIRPAHFVMSDMNDAADNRRRSWHKAEKKKSEFANWKAKTVALIEELGLIVWSWMTTLCEILDSRAAQIGSTNTRIWRH